MVSPRFHGKEGSLRRLKKSISEMPITVAQEVAIEAVSELNAKLRFAYLAGKTVYGDDRPEGVDGRRLTLMREPPVTFRTLRFVQEGTILRCALGTKYAKYLIGKYRILPIGDRTDMPIAWQRALNEIAEIALGRYWARQRAA